MEENALISIVLTLYNKAPYIEETIFSIYKQTYTNRELIIVDDCSTDGSLDIAKSFCEKLGITNKCKYIQNKKNLWVAKTFERGLKEAKGDWISMCDGDDILMKDKLEKNLEFCIKNNVDLCYSDLIGINEYNNIIYHSYFKKRHVNLKNKTYKDFIYEGYAIGSSNFFSKKIGNNLKEIGFPTQLYQDRRPLLYSSIKKYSIGHINKPLVYYRRCKSSITRNIQNKIQNKIQNIKKTNNDILRTYRENISGENNRLKYILDYILQQNIGIEDEDLDRCKKHIQMSNLVLNFIDDKKIFMKYEIFKLLFILKDKKYYYRVFIIQVRKILTLFNKS